MDTLTIFMMICALGTFGLRRYSLSILSYQIGTFLLVCVFYSLYSKYEVEELKSWAFVAFFTKVIFVPCVLYYLVKKLKVVHEVEPVAGFFISPIIALSFSLAIATSLYKVFSQFALLHDELPLIASGFIFMMGIFGFVLRKSFIKQILAYCLFENGIHLSLALMAYNSEKIVEIGILTDAIFAVIIMSVLAVRFYNSYDTLDTSKASALKG